MKYYISYMDRQEVSPAVHERLLRLERPRRPSAWVRYGALAACAVLVLGLGVWRLTSSAPDSQMAQDALYPGIKDWYGPGEIPPDEAPDQNPQGAVKGETKGESPNGGTEDSNSRGEPAGTGENDVVPDAAGTPLWEGETFASLDEARQEEDFAPYLPAAEPEGYGDFSGTRSGDTLSVLWSRGYDNIQVSVHLEGSRSYHLADPARPETYDLRLYEIPWCDSVPEQYLSYFLSTPLFRAEDMSLDIVEARMMPHDTGGQRCDFSILHENGVVVTYHCGGMTAQQIWAMAEAALPSR